LVTSFRAALALAAASKRKKKGSLEKRGVPSIGALHGFTNARTETLEQNQNRVSASPRKRKRQGSLRVQDDERA
jgi:hypothetical protein